MKKLIAALLLLAPAAADAGNYKLMGKLDLFGGQYFFGGQSGAFNGYGVLDAQLARSYSPSAGFFASLRSVYTGFKQVNELAGGGTLFQQSLDNSLGFKLIRRYEGGYSLKPRAAVKNQLFRETKDEKWGEGLYDFMRYEAGVTLERKTRLGLGIPWTWQLSWDAYYTRYTRFKSLASQYGQELAAPNPGTRVLDTLTNQFSYATELDLPNFKKADFLFSLAMIDYQDQKVINSEGRYLSSKRSDYYQALNLGLSKRYNDIQALGGVRPVLGAGLSLANLISNQSHLDTDPAHLKFIRGFYDYTEVRLSPSAQFTFIGTGLITRFNYDFAVRGYTERLAQRGDGSYTSKKLAQYSSSFTAEAAYPLARSLDVKVQGTWAASRSNNRYEQVYRYNYDSSSYFAGMEWRF
ncbi:MAG: hypothetical protein NDI60_03700 [Elusimicrobiales bacterium]|nr:hypothetical protein [Elusimicrobiales bacterium]